jgi:hypothetical protein
VAKIEVGKIEAGRLKWWASVEVGKVKWQGEVGKVEAGKVEVGKVEAGKVKWAMVELDKVEVGKLPSCSRRGVCLPLNSPKTCPWALP